MSDSKVNIAVQYSGYGQPADVIRLVETKVPTIGDLQVLLKVQTAAINPVDWKFLLGKVQSVWPRTFPSLVGFDIAGTVVAVGSHVTRFKVGDEVFGDINFRNIGSFQQYAAVDETVLVKKPTNYSWREAAGVPLAGLTSYQALRTHGDLKRGQKVLILGGTSATGLYALQIARNVGAHVTTTAGGEEGAKLARSYGADAAVDYKSADWGSELKGGDFDVVFDTVGVAGSWEKAVGVLKTTGRFVGIAGNVGKSIEGGPSAKSFLVDADRHDELAVLKDWAEAGHLRSPVDRAFPFTQQGVVDLFNTSIAGRAKGKLILDVTPQDS